MLPIAALAFGVRSEQRMVWPYGQLEDSPRYDSPSGYAARRAKEAKQAGFEMLGWTHDLKGDRYKTSYAMLVSPERDCFALIGAGTMMKVVIEATAIYSRTSADSWTYSTDKLAAVEMGAMRSWIFHVVPNADFASLIAAHRTFMDRAAAQTIPLEVGREVASYRMARDEYWQLLAKRGIIEFIDRRQDYFRYTFRGAIQLAAFTYSTILIWKLSRGRYPRTNQ